MIPNRNTVLGWVKMCAFLALPLLVLAPSPSLAEGTLSGVVLTGKAAPAPGFEVVFLDATSAAVAGQTTTAADGSFSAMLPAGTYRVRASGYGNDPEFYCARGYYVLGTSGVDLFEEGSVVPVSDDTRTLITIDLPRLESGSCVYTCPAWPDMFIELFIADVSDPAAGIEGIQFELRDAYDALPLVLGVDEFHVKTGEPGQYYLVFSNVPLCEHLIRIRLIDPSGFYLPEYLGAGQSDSFLMGKVFAPSACSADGKCKYGDLMAAHPGSTPSGPDVVVQPVDPNTDTSPVTVTFDNVTGSGETTVTTSSAGTPPPNGFKLGSPPVYYTIETTAVYSGPIGICINYSRTSFGNEENLRLFHEATTGWEDVTTSLDTTNDIICGAVSSFSLFGVFEPTFSFTGFLPPIENPPQTNRAKAGQTIPLRWRLVDSGGSYVADVGAVTGIWYQQTTCGGTSENEVYETDTCGSSGLRYDFEANQFVYTWKTDKAWAGNCYNLIVLLNDGSEHGAYFELK